MAPSTTFYGASGSLDASPSSRETGRAILDRKDIPPAITEEETIGTSKAAPTIARCDQGPSMEAEEPMVAAIWAIAAAIKEAVNATTPIANAIGRKSIVRITETITTIGMKTERLATTTTTSTSTSILTNTGRVTEATTITVRATIEPMDRVITTPITSMRSADEVAHVRHLAQQEKA